MLAVLEPLLIGPEGGGALERRALRTVDHLKERRVDSFEKATELREEVVKAGEKLVEHRIEAGFTFVRRFTYLTRRGVLHYVAKNASER